MTRIVLSTRLIVEAARRGRLAMGPAGVLLDGEPVDDNGGREVVDLCDAGYLTEDGDRLVPSPLAWLDAPSVDEVCARWAVAR